MTKDPLPRILHISCAAIPQWMETQQTNNERALPPHDDHIQLFPTLAVQKRWDVSILGQRSRVVSVAGPRFTAGIDARKDQPVWQGPLDFISDSFLSPRRVSEKRYRATCPMALTPCCVCVAYCCGTGQQWRKTERPRTLTLVHITTLFCPCIARTIIAVRALL